MAAPGRAGPVPAGQRVLVGVAAVCAARPELDEAGLLTLSSHGSTASAVLAAAEALLLTASTDGAILLGDDFGDGLDAATAEHLAAGTQVLTLGFGG